MKRPPPANLVLRALDVVEDAISRSQRTGPLTGPEIGFRFALAFLYAIASDETDYPQPIDEAFKELWACVTGQPNVMCDGKPAFRSSWARTQLASIQRRVGAVSVVGTTSQTQRRMIAESRERLTELIRQANREPFVRRESVAHKAAEP